LDLEIIDFGEDVGNKRRPVVPINSQLHEALTQAQKITVSDYVIEYRGKPIKDVKKAIQRAAKAAKLDMAKHTLRHTAATWMVMDGRPFEEVAKYLGTTKEIAENTYGHMAPDFLKAASKALEL